MRYEVEGGWFELKDLGHINYGEAKALRKLAANGDEDGAEKMMLGCLVSWELKDARGELVSEVTLDNLYRLSLTVVGAIGEAVTKELAPQIPLASSKEPETS